MFDNFFKRPVNPLETNPVSSSEIAVEAPTREKELALQKARALSDDETEAMEFILQCPFADARLIAAERLHSREILESVLTAVRNSDRRVTRLMQGRLEALTLDRRSEQQAQQCVDRARQLADEAVVLSNQVVDLDHAWQVIVAPPDALRAAFDELCAVLRSRLEAQAQSQHAVIGNLARLRALASDARAMTLPDALAAFDRIEQDMAQHLAAREAPSLPKNLLADFSEQHGEFKSSLESLKEFHQAKQARETLLQQWEAVPTAADLNADTLKYAWLSLPALPEAEAEAMQCRFDALLLRVDGATRVAAEAMPTSDFAQSKLAQPKNDMAKTLESMQAALQEGATRAAMDLDKLLRLEEARGIHLSGGQGAHLAKMRGELSHLQGWAKWGGNVSREELLKAAEELQGQTLPPAELAKKVGGLRDRWKSLDTLSGPAGKDIWARFDAACTLAYAPAASHFKKLGEERRGNLLKGEALIAEVRQFGVASHCTEDGAVDWKALASFCMNAAQRWQRLGGMDRKEKKRLDGEFGAAMRLLEAPLAVQRQNEAARRENLIVQASALNPTDRGALDAIRALQERWQQMAKGGLLERKVEQALWKKFRAACDVLFAKRKDAAAGADADRKHNFGEKEDLCAKLESSLAEPAASVTKILRETKEAWNKIGPVPRATEKAIETRFHAASMALQKQLDAAKRASAEAESNALLNKMRLCRSLEQNLAEAEIDAGVAAGADATITLAQWQALPALSNEFERALKARFDHALKALQAGDAQYRTMLETNRSQLLRNVLRVEIVAGVESPAELSRERLKMQVEVLQSALKNGPVTNKQGALLELCKLPALADQTTMARVERLIGKLAQK